MIVFFKLIRFPNLLVIAIVQYLMRYAIMQPVLELQGYQLQMSNIDFLLLVLSTTLLAAAGYVINDYFDRKSDMINRPSIVVVGKGVNRRWAMVFHVVLNTIAIIIGLYLTYKLGIYKCGIIYFIAPGLLWYYSTFFKKKLLIRNFILASFVALIPLLVPLFEIPLLKNEYNAGVLQLNNNFQNLFLWILSFAFFAFMMTLITTLIKDIANKDGDVECGYKTMPIVLGSKAAKLILYSLSFATITISVYILVTRMLDVLTLVYYILTILLPFVLLMIKISLAKVSNDYKRIEWLPKFIMIAGIAYTILAYFLIQNPEIIFHVF